MYQEEIHSKTYGEDGKRKKLHKIEHREE